MDIKYIRLLHDMLFHLIGGALINGAIWLVTGEPVGLLSTLLYGWVLTRALETATAKRRVAEIDKLRTMYDQPTNTEK